MQAPFFTFWHLHKLCKHHFLRCGSPSTGKHDFAAPRNRLNHAPFGLEDGIDGREKHRKNGDIDAQHHQFIPKDGMQEGQNARRKMPGNAIQRRPGDG